MTDLIPRDAAIAACQNVADESKSYGILQMTMGANTCRDAIRTIRAIDPAAIREAAVELGDLGDDLTYFPTLTEHGLHTRAYELSKRILALIGEKK